jgi:membrane protease YdiL (CAAX protease family)
VLVSAILYGSAHLWVHQFPNWRRAAVGTLLGVVFGILYAQTGSVRAPMVTHALVVATWRVFFK